MELTSVFKIDGSNTIDGELVTPSNYQNAFMNLSFDKDSIIAKSKGVVSTTEWEFTGKAAIYLRKKFDEGLTGGTGALEGIPFEWIIQDDGITETVFNGYLDLSTAKFECDMVTLSSRERKKIDDLNSKVDGFTYEKLLSIGRIIPADYTYVPYSRKQVENLGLALLSAQINLIILIIQLQQAITELIKLIIGLVTFTWADLFKAVIQTAYTIFLTRLVAEATFTILKLIIQPIKFHAGMSELRLMQIGSEFLGYEFRSSILEGNSFVDVIIPEKYSIITNPDDDLITGFTKVDQMINSISLTTNHVNEQGYFNGTFGDVIRILKTKYNAKIIIEDNPSGNTILRLEREDYIGDDSALFNMPSIENNEAFTLNREEFKSNYLLEYTLDASNKTTYINYEGTVYQSQIKPKTIDDTDLTLMTGLETKTIGLAKGKRKNELTREEEAIAPLLDIISEGMGVITRTVNSVLLSLFLAGNEMIDQINNVIDTINSLPGGINIPNIDPGFLRDIDEIPFLEIPNLLSFSGDRIGVMEVEDDRISVPTSVRMNISAVVTPSEAQLQNQTGIISEAYQTLYDYSLSLGGQQLSTDFLGNRLVANHNDQIGAKSLYDLYHYINSFVPTTNGNPNDVTDLKHNQWLLYEFNDFTICMDDFLKIKSNNNIIFGDKIARVESLEWNIYQRTANISFRVNKLWTNNLQLENNEPIGR